ncbi:MAG TPA: exodeoxyribonuclease VII large subunit [Bacteroidales bacterium]|nr:exodeoxyribonuclease VII large subunit [Bacteroidales bacterium]
MIDSISLSELSQQVTDVIQLNFAMPVWVRAEISELRENNGHCYLELIEKDEDSHNIIAKARATIWSSTYRMLKPYFESSTSESLRAGLNVLVSAKVEYSGLYGFSLNIRDIDPVFTIGELAARRLQIIRQLEEEGVVDINKSLPFPTLPQRLAIISSKTAAGYGDFCDQLKNNSSKFAFYPKLFPAIMQGMQAEASIIQALEKIFEHIELFDVVIIIRGGGATTDLSCFDNYNLALNCAQFPLPIIAGIGHQRDVSILDMVAHTSVKTPTAAAEFLISKLSLEKENLRMLVNSISDEVMQTSIAENRRLDMLKLRIRQAGKTGFLKENNRINALQFQLKNLARKRIMLESNKLQLIETKLKTHSPEFLIERGYSITTLNGKRLTSKEQVKEGDQITTHLSDGSFESVVSK